jgi:hypothetical protein
MSSTIGAFVPENTDALFRFHFDRCGIANLVTGYNSIDQLSASRHNKKIACLQFPYPIDPKFTDLVAQLLTVCDQVLILMSELHDRTVEFVQQHDHERISYFICGEFNFQLHRSPVHKFYDWFTTSVHFYRFIRPTTLDTLNPYSVKLYYFDALLGRKKPHRDFAYKRLATMENNIVTYSDDVSCDFNDPAKWIWELDGLESVPVAQWTVERVRYYGHMMTISQIIPLSVYNKTAYTLVAETSYSNHYNFYTEKTVKPILGRRLFLSLSGQNQMANLRKIGFQTFGDIVDESYDQEPMSLMRYDRVLDQIRYLQTQSQEEVLEKLKPICDHNFRVMITTNWYDQYFRPAFSSYFNQ